MNKRKIKKQKIMAIKKWKKTTPKEFQVCLFCGEELNPLDKWQMRYGACNVSCYGRAVGAEGFF